MSKKFTFALMSLFLATTVYGKPFSLSDLQFTGGFKNINYTKNKKYSDSINGISFSLSKQYQLPGDFSAASGFDYSLGYNNKNNTKVYKNTIGLVQTFYYVMDQGTYTIRPLLEIGLGLKADSTTFKGNDIESESKTYEYYTKYNVGVEGLLTNGIGGQFKYGHEYNRNRIVNPTERTTDRSYSISMIYFLK